MSMTIQSSVKDKILPDSSLTQVSLYKRLQDVKFARILYEEIIVARNEILRVDQLADGQSGCMVQTMGDIMRACVIDFSGLLSFEYLGVTPFDLEALYGRKFNVVLTKEEAQKRAMVIRLYEFKSKEDVWGTYASCYGILVENSCDKTLRLVEEPIEIGDYKGKRLNVAG
ncbi:hypothetical protein Tco_0073343 [Tanacetum coccineum]